jgi:multisubunit Na+/H+ antiporter MnhE subunit
MNSPSLPASCSLFLYFSASKMTFCAFMLLNKSYPSRALLMGIIMSAIKLGKRRQFPAASAEATHLLEQMLLLLQLLQSLWENAYASHQHAI